ncbi:glyoxalase family protein [Virgibacillus halotolerans]|uniref:ring-cleaving dioxygenase n=1 Tax=Virgibacillus halotolerans TaxID=1071053 RepID=UPI0019614137|nr:ring-cleaving dioxygenase [Virgibacillus halotolerans]MBM7598827.1 glyoxalase family protein [Virgibacillus halotolerans]
MIIKGIHHVSAHTAHASENYDFYTRILGMRLVKKSVNQDSPSMYHLFYADEIGNPGTDLTFFEIPMLAKTHRGTNSISNTSLRVANDASLKYWEKRFREYGVKQEEITERAGHQVLAFEDSEGQRLTLVSDEKNSGVQPGTPWDKSPVPKEHGITGLGPVRLTVRTAAATAGILKEILGFKQTRSYASDEADQPDILVFETGKGGNGSEIHLEERRDLPVERPGRGSVHHVAFRVDNEEEMHRWVKEINAARLPNSGFVDRYYFRSLYFREPNGILFELATDGPGFATDEDVDHLGESLALPPFLESQRDEIEQGLKPIDTK